MHFIVAEYFIFFTKSGIMLSSLIQSVSFVTLQKSQNLFQCKDTSLRVCVCVYLKYSFLFAFLLACIQQINLANKNCMNLRGSMNSSSAALDVLWEADRTMCGRTLLEFWAYNGI